MRTTNRSQTDTYVIVVVGLMRGVARFFATNTLTITSMRQRIVRDAMMPFAAIIDPAEPAHVDCYGCEEPCCNDCALDVDGNRWTDRGENTRRFCEVCLPENPNDSGDANLGYQGDHEIIPHEC